MDLLRLPFLRSQTSLPRPPSNLNLAPMSTPPGGMASAPPTVSTAPCGLVNPVGAQGPSGVPQTRCDVSDKPVPIASPPDSSRYSSTMNQRRTVLTATLGAPLKRTVQVPCHERVAPSALRPPAMLIEVRETEVPVDELAYAADVLDATRADRLVSHASAAGSTPVPSSPRKPESGPPAGGTAREGPPPRGPPVSCRLLCHLPSSCFLGDGGVAPLQTSAFDDSQEYYNDEAFLY